VPLVQRRARIAAMPDSDPTDFDAGATVELAAADVRGRLAAEPQDLRDQLPGLEPERRVTDWGRSERLESLVDRTVYEFLYRHWHRVEVEGIGNVPPDGPALLVANHSGILPAAGPMVVKALREDHPRPRLVHIAIEQHLNRLPGLGMLLTKLGAIPAHPANIHRLLFDERQLVLMFPEGTRKALRERYRLRRFHDSGFVRLAVEAEAPLVPVAVVGAEEASPLIAGIGPLRGLPRMPLAPMLSLPAKFKIRFLEPIETHGVTSYAELGEDIRALLQENLLEMVAQRRSVWLG
jgi:1-acyl-sn-glycerol-3-phosphate acyltransferase